MQAYPELYFRGDALRGGFTSGMTYCMSDTSRQLEKVREDEERTVYESPRGATVTMSHTRTASGAVEFVTEVTNHGQETLWLDMLSSFPCATCRRIPSTAWSPSGVRKDA